MNITNFYIKNFRSHSVRQFNFQKGINVLVGENGCGKTNIVEAIYYLSLARSFRGVDDKDLIKIGTDLAEINTTVKQNKITKKIKIIITKEGRRIFIDNKPINKISELSNNINVIIFEPKDVDLFKGLPKYRRNFLDISLSKKSLVYLDYITRYNRILKQRNDLLKNTNIDQILLETNTDLLIKTSQKIIEYRSQYIKDIINILNKIIRALTREENDIEIIYKPYITPNKDFYLEAKELYKKSLEADIKQKSTTIGIHREDFIVNYNGKDIATYGSQGENRIVALCLKLAPYFSIEEEKKPIVILDDVLSELDEMHQKQLLEFIKKFDQVFITTTKLNTTDNVHCYQIK